MVQQHKNKRITIIGAGLGGLCLAQGLKKNGIHFTVFEKDLAINTRSQGYRIRINEPGRKALQQCLPHHLYHLFLETCAASYSGMNVLTPQLDISKNELVESWSDGVKEMPDLKPNRLTLREILLQGLEEHICFGKELISWQELESGEWELSFADGTTHLTDLVVAADGVHSKIGKEYCKDTKINTGNITIYGRTFYTPEALRSISCELQKGTSVIIGDRFSLITDSMVFDFSKKGNSWNLLSPISNYFYWAFIGDPQAFGLAESDVYSYSIEEIFECVRKLTHEWHPQLKALFDYADKASLSINPIRSSLPKEKWESGNITALGDAVHTMSPAGGVGANTAFMDAALLTENLVNNMCISIAVSDYENKMRIYSNQAIKISLQGGEILHGIKDKED
ncbi:NAD(P)-binding protein [Chryseobacterium sp. Tr-659]|uniref:FAD-dependent oxidoreductase n=1 Tax=Chryseobacterium sp. Tr-659 TaxID=2608340 RepID=UPI00141F0F8E|nr:FAD-dependent monooxygenase [Chryseobacterium sp. Tr-659]NIF04623.1 NAD(P)-binding protein [Chryseobacterium sp. Tr-659]